MPNFYFYLDKRVSIVERSQYYIDADSKVQAVGIMMRIFNETLPPEDYIVPYSTHLEENTARYMTPEENKGEATKELILFVDNTNSNDISIMDNSIPPTQNPHV